MRNQIVISYSHHDRAWLERLQVYLKPLERQLQAKIWDDTRIQPGKRWKPQIRRAMETARVAIILVSGDYLASDFVAREELPELLRAAEQEDITILPLIVGPTPEFARKLLTAYQSVEGNSPDRPLNAVSQAEQEAVFARLADFVASELRREIEARQQEAKSETRRETKAPEPMPEPMPEPRPEPGPEPPAAPPEPLPEPEPAPQPGPWWRVHRLTMVVAGVAFLAGLLVGGLAVRGWLAPPDDLTLELTASGDSLPADGYSRLDLTATVPRGLEPEARHVVFQTTKGRFKTGGGEMDASRLEVAADAGGIARAQLVGGVEAGTALVSASLARRHGSESDSEQLEFVVTDSLEILLEPPVVENTVRLEAASATAPADGESATKITVSVNPELPSELRDTTVETTFGRLEGSDQPYRELFVGGSNQETIDLLSPIVPGVARVSVFVGQLSASTPVEFVPALPDEIFVRPPQQAWPHGTWFKVEALLERRSGRVSEGTPVTFSVHALEGLEPHMELPIRVAYPARTDLNGLAVTELLLEDTGYTGTAILRADVEGSGAASTEARLEVVPP